MKRELYKIDLGAFRLSVRTHSASFGYHHSEKKSSEEELLHLVHAHSAYELFAVIGGEISVVTEKNTFTCRDSIVIIPSNLRHYVVFKNTSAVILNFIPQAMDQSFDDFYSVIISHISGDVVIYPINSSERFYCEKLMKKEDRLAFAEVEENLLVLLFAEIFSRFMPEEKVDLIEAKNQYVTVIDSYISLNSSRRIHLKDIANELHLCSKQVSRIIKKEYGCTLAELVARHRVGIAQMLLAKTEMKTYEISESVGYESPKDFRLNFKKVCGQTPTEYRKEMKKGN